MKLLYIIWEMIKKTKHILLHELGHILDTYDEFDGLNVEMNGKYTLTGTKFKELFNEEKDKLVSYTDEKLFLSDVEESFAECFAIFIDSPEIMAKNTPKLFNYFNYITKSNIHPCWNTQYTNKTFLFM